MTLAVGHRFGVFEILGPIGAGGMGEVYRARDTRLQREVALKVLPHALSGDPQRLVRFEREARLFAALNHPNIAQVYGLEEVAGVRALVMELVEGVTLRDLMTPLRPHPSQPLVPLAVSDALRTARQIAAALDAAHAKGIVHRDLKPSNIQVRPDGTVKVLDFGLAKALQGGISADAADFDATLAGRFADATPTFTSPVASLDGAILGTASYMSPEQAQGRPVDKRADIWAFGCVLYEMLSGRKAFSGATVSECIASILSAQPDFDALPAAVPTRVRQLVRRCLERDLSRRLRDIGDAFVDDADADAVAAAPPPARTARAGKWAWPAAVLLTLALAATLFRPQAAVTPEPTWVGDLLGGPSVATGPRVSPDGHTLAFTAMVHGLYQVALMKPDSGDWTVLTHDRTNGWVSGLSWSPDGTRIYFSRSMDGPRGVFSVPVLGGEPRPVLADAGSPEALPDGTLLVTRPSGSGRAELVRFNPATGQSQRLPADWPALVPPLFRAFPNGKSVVVYAHRPSTSDNSSNLRLYTIAIDGGATKDIGAASLRGTVESQDLAVSPDGRQVVIGWPAGNLHTLLAVPVDGATAARPLVALTVPVMGFDFGADGSLFLDQFDRTPQALLFAASGGPVHRVMVFPGSRTEEELAPLALPDGRVVLPSMVGGRDRLLVVGADNQPTPLLDAADGSSTPAVMINDHEIAFRTGTPPNRILAIASLATGQIIRKFEQTRGARIRSLAVSADRQTLFYAGVGGVWALPCAGGTPRLLSVGDGVAVDPVTGDVIIQLFEAAGPRLLRLPAHGGPATPIAMRGDYHLARAPLAANAIGPNGQMLVTVVTPDSWFWSTAILDLRTGLLRRIPLRYDGDVGLASWTSDGRIVCQGVPVRSALWRFHPIPASQPPH